MAEKTPTPLQAVQTMIEEFRVSDAERDAGLTTPADIRRWDDIPYGSDQAQVLDVYRPRSARGKLPVIVSVHGGGWVYGDKELYQHYCMSLAQRGFAVVNFTYRLVPDHLFPSSVEDTNTVFQWVVDHAGAYRMDAEHIFAVGDSAGANQLALYCCMLADPAFAATFPFPMAQGVKLRAVALNCGLYDLTAEGQNPTDNAIYKLLFPNGGTRAELDQMSPVRHVTPAFPPAFVMTCLGDFLAGQAPLMAAPLKANQVPCVEKVYGTEDEPLVHVFHCNMRLEAGRQCNDDECAFFRRFL